MQDIGKSRQGKKTGVPPAIKTGGVMDQDLPRNEKSSLCI
jgi:hypothetical protein